VAGPAPRPGTPPAVGQQLDPLLLAVRRGKALELETELERAGEFALPRHT
jgi:hypothetical protein